MNLIENPGEHVVNIRSHIDNNAVKILVEMCQNRIITIRFWQVEPNENDLKILNLFFAGNKKVFLGNIKNWWIEHLPNLEYFEFEKYDEESISLIKKNKVVALVFSSGQKRKYDISILLQFKNTIEYLSLTGKFDNLETTINQMEKLKTLELVSLEIDLSLLTFDECKIETFWYYGSKVYNLENLSKIKTLKTLGIKRDNNLENVDFIKNLVNLEKIDLSFISKITYFPNLEKLDKLKKIWVSSCNKLANIEEVKKLKNVWIWICCDLVDYENK